ncbi:MAG: hypothetical protein IJZ83_06740 [Clostridia bacterium]|nr:hypothetical protein [Clostridia bacterium]
MKKRISVLIAMIMTLAMVMSAMSAVFAADATVADSVYTGDYDLQDEYYEKYSKDKENGVTQYDVYTADAFYVLAGLISGSADGFKGCTISIKCDLVFNEGNASDWATTAPKNAWTSIGASKAFEGTLDGEGHTISGIYISKPSQDHVGLIAKATENAVIKNLGVINSYYLGASRVGGILGSIMNASAQAKVQVTGCYSNAIVIATKDTVSSGGWVSGGIVGWNASTDSVISNCAFAGSAKGTQEVGGILGGGRTCNSTIKNCVNLGKIEAVGTSNAFAAGISGNFYGGTIEKCYNAGTVLSTKTEVVGSAIAGQIKNTAVEGAIKDCYIVTGLGQTPVVAGVNASSVSFSATSVAASSIKGDGAKTALTAFDFDNEKIWSVRENDYPVPTAVKTILDGVANIADPSVKDDTPPADDGNENVSGDNSNNTPETNEDTKASETTAAPETTDVSDTEAEKGGCGASMMGASVAVVMAVGSVCAVVSKKRR